MPTRAREKSRPGFYFGVGIVCAAVMALQILQSRIFSVVTWYHLSFLTISIAMFGLTLGALQVYRGDAEEQRRNLGKHLSHGSLCFGLLTVLSLIVQMRFPIIDKSFQTLVITLPLVAGICAAAYFYAGQVVSLCLTRSGLPVGRVYAADMVGASAGCLGAILLMKAVDTPSAVLLVAAVSVANGLVFDTAHKEKGRWLTVAVAIVLALGGILNAAADRAPVYPFWTKGIKIARNEISFEKWNAISRVTVTPAFEQFPVFLWGPSPKLPVNLKSEYQYLRVDGAAGTPIIKFDGKNFAKVRDLEYDVTNIAHFLPGIRSYAIIGAGGGRDILSALYFKAKRVVAMDINDTQIGLLTKEPQFRDYTNLWSQPGVEIVNSEARSWLTQHHEKFDGIQMSMIDTWVSAAAGAFALTENSLYTVDAFKVFLRRLTDNGVLTVSRWHNGGDQCNDLCRLGTISVKALLDLGQAEPRKNIFAVHADRVVTFIVSRQPFTTAQLDALHAAARKFGYDIMITPRETPKVSTLRDIVNAKSGEEITAAIKDLNFDVSPSTDNRPFFFNQARIWRPWDVIRQAREGSMSQQNLLGHAVATVNLYAITLFSILASVLVLVLPFKASLKHAPRKFLRAGTAYFALIGLGFMFVEITLMQMMSMFLGHPVYGLGVVLFGMILSSGIGSFLSETYVLDTRRKLIAAPLCLMLYLVVIAGAVGPLMEIFIEESFPARLAVCLLLIFPAGLMMGFAFPTGMRLTERISDKLTPWFWGINGAFGVVASAVAMVISIGFGLPVTILAGALCYGFLAIPAARLLKQRKRA